MFDIFSDGVGDLHHYCGTRAKCRAGGLDLRHNWLGRTVAYHFTSFLTMYSISYTTKIIGWPNEDIG